MENVSLSLEPLRAFLSQVGLFMPRILIAVLVVVAGWLLAKLARFVAVKALRAINFNVLTERAGMDEFLSRGGLHSDTTALLGILVQWLVILAALMIAFNGLGLSYVTDLIGRIILFIPRVLVAVLILAVGAYFARFVATAIGAYAKSIGSTDAGILSRAALYGITLFVVVIALDQIGIGVDIIRESFLIILAGVVLALALAFGLGGREQAGRMLDRWMPGSDDDFHR
jgi:hypothetical protein